MAAQPITFVKWISELLPQFCAKLVGTKKKTKLAGWSSLNWQWALQCTHIGFLALDCTVGRVTVEDPAVASNAWSTVYYPKKKKINKKRIPFIWADTAGGVLIVHWVQYCLRGRRAFSTFKGAQGTIWEGFLSLVKKYLHINIISCHSEMIINLPRL